MPTLVRAAPVGSGRLLAYRFPYSPKLVAAIKQVPGLWWDRQATAWCGTRDTLAAVKAAAGEAFVKVADTAIRAPTKVPNLGRFKLYPFQEAAVDFMQSRPDGWILSDAPGVGKTRPALAWAAINPGKTLIVYPAAGRSIWRREAKLIGLPDLVECEGRTRRMAVSAGGSASFKSAPLIGCHYEILTAWEQDLLSAGFSNLIVDEVHMAQNRTAQRTRALFSIASEIGNKGALSGTLLRTGVRNLWSTCEIVRPGIFGGHWGSAEYEGSYVGYWRFARFYAGAEPNEDGYWDDSGFSTEHENELRDRLADFVLRRERHEVRGDLPPYARQIFEVGLTNSQLHEYDRAARRLLPRAEIARAAEREEILNQLQELVDGMKLGAAADLIDEAIRAAQKIVVFTHFHASLKKLAAMFDSPGMFLAGGWMSPQEREPIYEAFKGRPGGAVLLANTLSSGIAIDLSCAERVLFTTLEWVIADLIQAESRPQRGAQANRVFVQYLIAPGTVDAAMATALFSREQVSRALFGEDPQARSLAVDFDHAGYVDHEALRPVGDRPAEIRQAALANMLATFKRNRTESRARGDELLGGSSTDDLLEEGEECPD